MFLPECWTQRHLGEFFWEGCRWDLGKLSQVVPLNVVDHILQVHFLSWLLKDKLELNYSFDGAFSTKSVRSIVRQRAEVHDIFTPHWPNLLSFIGDFFRGSFLSTCFSFSVLTQWGKPWITYFSRETSIDRYGEFFACHFEVLITECP